MHPNEIKCWPNRQASSVPADFMLRWVCSPASSLPAQRPIVLHNCCRARTNSALRAPSTHTVHEDDQEVQFTSQDNTATHTSRSTGCKTQHCFIAIYRSDVRGRTARKWVRRISSSSPVQLSTVRTAAGSAPCLEACQATPCHDCKAWTLFLLLRINFIN